MALFQLQNFVTEYFRLKINALQKIILILADILQLNKTTVIASCGCFRKIIYKIIEIFYKNACLLENKLYIC